MKVLYKHHELNYFGPSYWRGIACAWNYSMHMQIHLLRYIKKSFDSIIYIYIYILLERYCIAQTKPKRNAIPS
jgi:hypothetical protein